MSVSRNEMYRSVRANPSLSGEMVLTPLAERTSKNAQVAFTRNAESADRSKTHNP
jgi:hypothetical protein